MARMNTDGTNACAVLIRRLVEILIIEASESRDIAGRIQGAGGGFFYFKDLMTVTSVTVCGARN
jgi:hypothetical protein